MPHGRLLLRPVPPALIQLIGTASCLVATWRGIETSSKSGRSFCCCAERGSGFLEAAIEGMEATTKSRFGSNSPKDVLSYLEELRDSMHWLPHDFPCLH
eukprot:2156808-Amphidinium_carterae.1